MTLSTALFIFAAQLLAYLVKGLIGFGNPLISAPILSMGLDNVVITPGTLLLDCPVNAWITWKNRHSFQWRKILPLLAANFCGVIPGTLLLRFSMPWVIKTVLGVVVVLLGLEMATRSLRPVKPDRKDRPWLRLAGSAFSGVCAGLFGINMFIVAYLQRTARDYSEFKGSMCFLFFGENAVRVVTYLVTCSPARCCCSPWRLFPRRCWPWAWRRGWGPGWKRKSSKRAPSSSSSWAASASS